MGSPAPNGYIHATAPVSVAQGTSRKADGKSVRASTGEVCCETVSPWVKFEKVFGKISSPRKGRAGYFQGEWAPVKGSQCLCSHRPVFAQTQPSSGSAILTRKLLLPSLPERQKEVCLATSSTQLPGRAFAEGLKL